ncbi:hypothetical protein M514_04734 [Trichuris suis]|uniref:Uncharacterized protein n=1 Tax=Trichuris suis TaxID=68888 RepID=A0A085MAZ5_9BILA|nr:hypothetical protein M513_04734 [Trichuris suis]KFD65782.1 hypothetical protein M514_04734 [Trichuris suis]
MHTIGILETPNGYPMLICRKDLYITDVSKNSFLIGILASWQKRRCQQFCAPLATSFGMSYIRGLVSGATSYKL